MDQFRVAGLEVVLDLPVVDRSGMAVQLVDPVCLAQTGVEV